MLTDNSIRQFTAHVASQQHAMAGATIAASAALACSLGEACVRINAPHLAGAEAGRVAGRLADIRDQLQALTDEDATAITAFAALRAAGKEFKGQDRLCQMPVEMGRLSAEAAWLLQDFRPLIQLAQDDLEMAITLLDGAARAAALLLDSNLRIWPDPTLLAKYEPELGGLRGQINTVHPVSVVRR
ncbi:MAG: cyclodeaminase/cyclohydrolase family protein [Chloroflexi bacterium]|nr:cyclodeaminase/cyclohydrolase family protein [Chloroflexota bacterium]